MVERDSFQKVYFALSNAYRMMIWCLCQDNLYNITQLSNELKISYKSTLQNIDILENAGLITRKSVTNEKGNATLIGSVSLTKFSAEERKLLDYLLKSLKEEQISKLSKTKSGKDFLKEHKISQ